MSKTFDIAVNGSRIAVREQGEGPTVVVLYGYGGVPHSSAFEDELAKTNRVVCVPLPGQQGADRGHDLLHTPLDWITAALDALEEAVGDCGEVHLVAQSVSGMLGGEISAIAPHWLKSLTLIGSLGMFDEADPTRNVFAESPPTRVPLMTKQPDLFKASYGAPAELSDEDRHEHDVLAYRADEATARLMWPFGDVGLKRRLHRVKVPVQLIWGAEDALVPLSYMDRFAAALKSPVRKHVLDGRGHLVALEAPGDVALLVRDFTGAPAVAA